MILQNVIHFYLGQQVRVKKKDFNDGWLTGRVSEVTRQSNHGDWIEVWFDNVVEVTRSLGHTSSSNAHTFFLTEDHIQLLLRPLSSMTEDEMKELYCCDVWAKATKKEIKEIGFDGENTNCVLMKIEGKINTATGVHIRYDRFYLNSLSSYQFQWLLSHGFDVFNLINRGLAIDASHPGKGGGES